MASPALGEGRVTRERYWRLVEEGVIGPDDRVELLEGVIVAVAPQGPAHAFVIGKLTQWLASCAGSDAFVRVQLPLDLGRWSSPEPDLALVAGRPDDFRSAHPTTALLAVEVAGRSVASDRLTKGSLYAAAGVPEFWLVNLRNGCVEVSRRPVAADRRYADIRVAGPGERLGLSALPGHSIGVDEILPPRG